jgi:hypothetical protein
MQRLATLASMLPLLGACASLIGLEDAAVDETSPAGTEASGTESSGTESSGTESTPASSGGGDGGAQASAGSQGEGGGITSSGTGAGGGALGTVIEMAGHDGVRLGVERRLEESFVVLLSMRSASEGYCYTSQISTASEAFLSFLPSGGSGCEPRGSIHGEGLRATSLDVRSSNGLNVGVGGAYRGEIRVGSGNVIFPVPDGGHGAFALNLVGVAQVTSRHLPFEIGGTPQFEMAASLPPPVGLDPVLLGGADSAEPGESCEQLASGGERLVFLDDPQAGVCDLRSQVGARGIGAASGPGIGAAMYIHEGSLTVARIPISAKGGGFEPNELASNLPASPDLRAFALRFVDTGGGGSYYLASGVSASTECGIPDVSVEDSSPFVARFAATATSVDCSGGVRFEPEYDRAIVGAGGDGFAVVGRHAGSTFDLVRLTFEDSGPLTNAATVPALCTKCDVIDIVLAEQELWILGRAEDSDATVGGTSIGAGTFLFHIPLESIPWE